MSRARRASPTLVAIGSVLVAAGTAVTLVLTLPVDAPRSLSTPKPRTVVSATHRTDADERQVSLALETGAPRAVVTSRTGIVTALTCTTGGTLHSGDVVATVDGSPVIAFAASVPLWRDLAAGERGDDVRALQAELSRLGGTVTVDGVVGAGTLRAARLFLSEHGVPAAELPVDSISVGAFAWIPAAETTVRSCSAVVGAAVPDGGMLVSLPAELRSARLEQVPSNPVDGPRRLRVGGATVDIGADGIIGDGAALRSIGALPEYQSAVASAEGAPTLVASWLLAEPLEVDVVPPDVLWHVADGLACVQPTNGSARQVALVGSELGQAFVRVRSGERLDRVRVDPDRSQTCR